MGVFPTLILKPTSTPLYELLSQVTYIFDDVGLVTNTDNDYGTVDGSGNVEKWKSIAPATVGADYTFEQTDEADPYPTLDTGIKFTGGQVIEAPTKTPQNQWSWLLYQGSTTDLKWTMTYVMRFIELAGGFAFTISNNPTGGNFPAIFQTYIDDRLGRDNGLQFRINQGNTSTAICGGTINSFYTPTIDTIYTLTYDHSLASANFKAYRGNTLIGTINKNADPTGSVTHKQMVLNSATLTPTSPFHWRTIIAQEVVETDEVRNAFINALKSKYSIT